MDASYHKIQLNTEMHKAQQFRNSASEISNSQQTRFILRWQLIYHASIVTILEQNDPDRVRQCKIGACSADTMACIEYVFY